MHPIGEAARLSGVAIETIRYYEREGIVPPAGRGANGRRLYSLEDVSRLRFVARCRALGFSIPDVVALLALSNASDAPCAAVKAIGERHLQSVRSKLADLQAMEVALAVLVKQCDQEGVGCPVLAELFG